MWTTANGGVAVWVGIAVSVPVAVSVAVAVPVWVGVAAWLPVAVAVPVLVAVLLVVGLMSGVRVGVRVRVFDGVAVMKITFGPTAVPFGIVSMGGRPTPIEVASWQTRNTHHTLG